MDPDDPVVFYAGAPIVTAEGLPLGSLCVLDSRPRRLTPAQKRGLVALAGRVMARLDRREALRQQAPLRREVDRPVRNSLASAATVSRLAARDLASDEVRAVLDAVQRRIGVLAELPREPHRADADDLPVGVSDVLGRILGRLDDTARGEVSVEGRFDPLALEVRLASPLRIGVMGLVANSMRHGFPDGRARYVVVEGRHLSAIYEATLHDDGIGKMDAQAPCLGRRVIDACVARLGGWVSRSATDWGYDGQVAFPVAGGG
jgi:two-component sensor histidine kinase